MVTRRFSGAIFFDMLCVSICFFGVVLAMHISSLHIYSIHRGSMSSDLTSKIQSQAAMFSNRLIKRSQYLKKWAKREKTDAYRVYDRDIPEIPLSVDLYHLRDPQMPDKTETYACLALYQRPYEKDPAEEELWLKCMQTACEEALQLPPMHTLLKTRKKQKGKEQYNKNDAPSSISGIVWENGIQFYVNLSDYLDTGLFLDHRPLRRYLVQNASEKRVLNLFGYTGALSLAAAKGGAAFVQTVDLSNTYLAWAEKSLRLNGFDNASSYPLTRGDVVEFLRLENRKLTTRTTDKRFDLILLDPPTFSNSSMTAGVLDINKQYHELVELSLHLLKPDGTLYFSTNSKRLSFTEDKLPQTLDDKKIRVADITAKSIPEDFKAHRIHRCWKIDFQN